MLHTMKERATNFPFKTASRNKACPYLTMPFPDCYCMNLSSQNIARMLVYCSENYFSCLIYRGRAKAE
jgi:hypothetical protein